MQIHRVRGRDLRDALERAGRLHGERALVLGHELAPGGGVTVAVSLAPRAARAERRGDPGAAAAQSGLADVERVLRRAGASGELVGRALAAVAKSGARGPAAIDAAAAFLGAHMRIAPSPRVSSDPARPAPTRVIAFVGSAGVGKTTTLVKLAARLARAGRRAGIATLDIHRPGACLRLEEYGRLLQVPVESAGGGEELAGVLARSQHLDALLVDTTGHSPRDVRALAELGHGLEAARLRAVLEAYLVLPATASQASLDEVLLGFDAARPSAAVITKLDETRQPAPVLEHAARTGLAVALLCDGQDVSRHLHRPRPDHFADLFLRGRLA